jgi:hypothetical protein
MPSGSPHKVTQLLADWSHGEDPASASEGVDDDFISK